MNHYSDYLYWKAAIIILGAIALATCVVQSPGFWSSYVLDIVGPAWIYILVRGQFSRVKPAMFSEYLSPEAALLIMIAACYFIEAAQYFQLYEAHYDPLDLIAYVSLVTPCYVIDRWLVIRRTSSEDVAV